MTEYPEHEKLQALGEARDTVQEFLDWLLYETEYSLCTLEGGHYEYASAGPERIMAEFFEIDLRRLSAEKDEMYRALVASNEARDA